MLLEWAEVRFDVLVKHTDESFPDGMPLAEIPEHIALQKALAVSRSLQQADEGHTRAHINMPILAADTLVFLQGAIIGKPENPAQAVEFLSRLSGQTHQVITGVAMLTPSRQITFSDTTEVTFHDLTSEQIAYYVNHYRPFDKAGAYAIQEWIGVTGIRAIKGDFYNVMGLPVSRVLQALSQL